ncbi:hypothetical protein [Polaribacter sp. Hel1_85]|uniref:hypothetical protein n=1 Tax=Polaribacter sp. Hel1_85 TaxID=1250005 RepID=UPI00056CE1A7|nr:hypothetical protein [Polaribacter sp. Hel1_85]
MRILKLTFLLLLIISCKENKQEPKSELKTESKESKSITEQEQTKIEMDSIYKLYKKGEVEKYDWDLAFKKAENYQKVSESYSDKKKVPNDFLEFSQKFIFDPNFQKAHIDFDNLIAVVGACEETYVLKKNNWVYDDWNFINEIGIDEKWENTFNFSDNIFYSEYTLKEIGTLTMLGFEKINGEWNLTLYIQNDC